MSCVWSKSQSLSAKTSDLTFLNVVTSIQIYYLPYFVLYYRYSHYCWFNSVGDSIVFIKTLGCHFAFLYLLFEFNEFRELEEHEASWTKYSKLFQEYLALKRQFPSTFIMNLFLFSFHHEKTISGNRNSVACTAQGF